MTIEKVNRGFQANLAERATSKGTGLGLSIVYSVVEQAGGVVSLERRSEGGTRCEIHLPGRAPVVASERQLEDGADADGDDAGQESDSGGGKLVLDMDGREVLSSVEVMVNSVNNLTTTGFRYTLPSDYSPRVDLKAIRVDKARDENGAHHETVMFK